MADDAPFYANRQRRLAEVADRRRAARRARLAEDEGEESDDRPFYADRQDRIAENAAEVTAQRAYARENLPDASGRVRNFFKGIPSGFAGFIGDLQSLAGGAKINPMQAATMGIPHVNRQALDASMNRMGLDTVSRTYDPQLPTTEDFGRMLGADPESGAFMAGTFLSPDPFGAAGDVAKAGAGVATAAGPLLTRVAKATDDEMAEAAGRLGDAAPNLVPPLRPNRSTIRGAERKAYPGIYDDPRLVAMRAEQQVAPESPALGRLFDVTRRDLARLAEEPGSAPGFLPGVATNPLGSAAAEAVMKPANTRRLVDVLDATETYAPRLREGMQGWYITEPAYQRLLELTGDPAEAKRRFDQLNVLTGMASPGSNVVSELQRGSAANMLHNMGRFDEFLRYGGLPEGQRISMGLPSEMTSFHGHPYHRTAQGMPMQQFLDTGDIQLKSPKVPAYIQASRAHSLGRQSDIPVGDAHWSRGIGLGDTRTSQSFGASVSNPEIAQLAPWWRDKVAAEAGLEAVPAQAIAWGAFGPSTGVETMIGAPKLEILADQIMDTAARMRISPEEARDLVLLGKAQAGGRLAN
ncbi:MAG: hypothetical protein QNI96_05080 [Woeseiaceae bacterium]|nr:hypothetical protein [Woeseiaceae bacterium]